MNNISLVFTAHQPNRLIPYDFFKIGEHAFYEDDALNAKVLSAVAERCYFPANRLMKQLIELSDGKFRLGLAVSGVILEQATYHRPDLIESFKELADTGCVDFLAMPYYTSLASIFSPKEFEEQIREHQELIQKLFGVRSDVLMNTGMLYSNSIAAQAETMGFAGIIADGNPNMMEQYQQNELCQAPGVHHTVTICRNRELSNDLAVYRTNPSWSEYPLSPIKFAEWLTYQLGQVTTLAMDYETLGERQSDATGVFEFWRSMINHCLDLGNRFMTPSEVANEIKPIGHCNCTQEMTCSTYGTLSHWMDNVMQSEAQRKIYQLEADVKAANDPDLTHVWRKLQSADHFHYMQKENSFTPYASAFDAYIYYMNALSDLQIRVKEMQNHK